MKRKFLMLLCLLSMLSSVLAYSVSSYYADYYMIDNWFSPDEVVAQDSTTGFYHYFYFPPNNTARWNEILRIRNAGLGVTIEYHYDHGEKIIDTVSIY